MQRRRVLGALVISVLPCASALVADRPAIGPQAASHDSVGFDTTSLREYFVVGTIVSINSKSAMVTLRSSDLLGRLRVKVKSYRVRQPAVLGQFQRGDLIKAVFSVTDQKLYHLRHFEASTKK